MVGDKGFSRFSNFGSVDNDEAIGGNENGRLNERSSLVSGGSMSSKGYYQLDGEDNWSNNTK